MQLYPGAHTKHMSPKSKGTGGLEQLKSETDVLGSSLGSGSYYSLQKVPQFLASLFSSLPQLVQGKETALRSSQVLLALAVQDCTTIRTGMEIKHGQCSGAHVLLHVRGQNHFYSKAVLPTAGFGVGLIQLWI